MSLMQFSHRPGEHAPFSPSSPSWLNYDDDTLINSYKNKHRSELGTEMHEWASIQIQLGNKVSNARDLSKSLKTYIFKKYEKAEDYRDMLLFNLRYLPTETYGTVRTFVNDCIIEHMASEQEVGYSEKFWGTADAIKFEKKLLQVFDLKTGTAPAKPEQLYIYAALYCLQYTINPFEITTEIRIYQNDSIFAERPEPTVIMAIMDKIVHMNKILTRFEGER